MATSDLFPLDGRRIAWGVIGTLGGVLLIFVGVFYLLFADPAQPAEPARPNYAQIRAEMGLRTDHELQTYGWVDREAGVVRIPVDVAAREWLAQQAGEGSGGR
jgi:hypothetical protein